MNRLLCGLLLGLASSSAAAQSSEYAAAVARQVAAADAQLAQVIEACAESEEKVFLISLNRKLDSAQALSHLRLTGATPLEAHLSVGERAYAFPLGRNQSDEEALIALRNEILAALKATAKSASKPPFDGEVEPENAQRIRQQEIVLTDAQLGEQGSSPHPMVNGWTVQSTCSAIGRVKSAFGVSLLAIEPQSGTRRGFAIILRPFSKAK